MIFDDSLHIEFADISHHQGFPPKFPIVDFHKMKLWGMRGCVIRASHGDDDDRAFIYNWAACRNVLPRAPYHYYENQVRPLAQAEKFWSRIEDDVEGMLFLDLEDKTEGKYYHWDYWYQFLEHLKRLSGFTSDDIGIYTGHYYITETFNNQNASALERAYFRQYKLWKAFYGPRNSNPLKPLFSIIPPTIPWTDNETLAIQTGTPVIGHAAGAYSFEMDYNRANGKTNFEMMFKTNYMLSNSISINIRRI